MDTQDMTDEEILEAIQEAFEEDGRLPMNYITIEVTDGSATINGRVSSEEETQIVDDIMKDSLKITDYQNKVWVDESLTYEDPDDESPDLRDVTFDDDDEIDEQEYDDDDEDEKDK